ncbi:MAG: hypothetical protein IJY50_05760 [Clostridia bacterium]|nr:hypothetical protein [Clostridia bacterium]
MKLAYRVISLLLALVLLCGTLAGCAATRKPLNYVKNALEKTIEKRFGGEVLELLLQAVHQGSIQLSYGGSDLYPSPLQGAEVKAWFDQEGERVSLSGSATIGDKTYDGQLHLTDRKLVMSSVAFFGSYDFGVDFDTLAKDLENSIFRNNSNTAFARPEVDGQTATELEKLKGTFFSLYDSIDEVLELSDELIEDFLTLLTEYAPHNTYTEDGKRYISATVNNTVLSRALRDTREQVVKDKDFCRELRELAKGRDAILSVQTGNAVTTYSDKVNNFIDSDTSMTEICAFIDALPAFELKLEAAVRRMSGVIDTAHISFQTLGVEAVAFDLDLSDDDTSVLSLRRGGVTRTLTFCVEKDGMRYYEANVQYESKADIGLVLCKVEGDLKADKREDAFSFTLRQGDETRVLEGRFDKKVDMLTASVDAVKINENEHRFAFSVTVCAEDRADPIPDYKNLITVTELEFAPVYDRITAAYKELTTTWGEYEIAPRTVLKKVLTVIGIEGELN